MIATGLSVLTQSGVGIAAATVSPMISYEISQKFKELAKDNPDGKLTEKQQAAHVLAHAVLGAAVAAAGAMMRWQVVRVQVAQNTLHPKSTHSYTALPTLKNSQQNKKIP